jgi:hypothetical protein
MRAETDIHKINTFMSALAARVGEGRIYLTGGATALLYGWRGMTVDIDLKADPEPAGFFEAIAVVKEELDINVELACPDQFIPPLPGWQERSPFIVRHRHLDFYHYDLYSQALAKIERGHPRDVADVRAMMEKALVEREFLQSCFERIQSTLVRYPGIDPASFRATFQQFMAETLG